MRFITAMISDQGGKAVNQDYAAFHEEYQGGIWALADGLGGYQGGEIAAQLAVQTILDLYRPDDPFTSIKNGIERSQQILHEEQKSSASRRSMRTTIVVLALQGSCANWAHVGDSRLYHFRAGQLLTQTKDHSVCQALVNAGEISISEIRFHEDRNRLYRVLGSDGDVKPAFLTEEVLIQKGDAFLLCSDGFWEYVTEEEMKSTRVRVSSPVEWLEAMESILARRVSEGNDNYSAVAVFIVE